MKKKYTIVYSEMFAVGSHRNYLTKYAKVETDNLGETLKEDIYNCDVWFVFDGWVEETKD